jgi:hypothetical protein
VKPFHAPRIMFLLALWLLGIGCSGSPPRATAPAAAKAKTSAVEKIPTKQVPAAFMPPVVCDDLLGDAAPLVAVDDGPTEDQMARVLNIANAVQGCPPDHPPRSDDLRVVLVQAREVLADWYSRHPGLRSASLAGNTSPMDGGQQPIMDARRWAEAYLQIDERLADLVASMPLGSAGMPAGMRGRKPQDSCSLSAPSKTKDGRRLDEILGWCVEPHVLMRVDAMAGALSNLLGQTPLEGQTDELQARLSAFRDAVLAEAAYWVGAPTFESQRIAVMPSKPVNSEVLLSTRISRVATHFKALALKWGDRPIDSLRTDLGNTFRSYVARLESHGIDVEDLRWPARVDDGIDPVTGKMQWTRSIRLRRLHAEILFDQVNLQAMFEIRDAEERWAGLLDRDETAVASPGQTAPVDLIQSRMEAVDSAAQLLLRGFRHTETRHARLEAISRIVLSVDLELGDQAVVPSANGSGKQPAAPKAQDPRNVALRAYASRVMGEIALCLLNDALLDMPSGHGCNYPMAPPPPAGWGADCSARKLASPFVAGKGAPPPIPERVAAAYDRVIAALEDNWTKTGRPPGEKPIVGSTSTSKATVCELELFTSVDTMARLAMSVRAYRRLVQLIADRRLPINPQQSGPVLAAGLRLVDQKMQDLCDTFDPGTCAAAGFQRMVQASSSPPARGAPPSKGQPPAIVKRAASEYCALAAMGEGMYIQSLKRGPGNAIPLIQIVEPHVGSLAWREIKALGDGFVRTVTECATAALASSRGNAPPPRPKK